MVQRAVVVCFVVATALGVASAALAQEATPSAGAAECTVEPYDLTTAIQLGEGTPIAAASPEATPTERPTGQPADEATVAAVTETIEQFVGCFNLGYQLRIIVLFTPAYLQTFLAQDESLTAEEISDLNEAAARESPDEPLAADQQTVIHSIGEVEVLDDGRVIATVIGDDRSEEGGPSPIYFIFAEVDGRYLIDGVIDPQPDATPAP